MYERQSQWARRPMNDGAKSQKATVAPDDVRRGPNKQSIVDISWVYAAVPNPCCPCRVIFILGYVFFASPRPLCASLKSSTTPEVHNLSQRRQKTTELYSQKSVKIEHVVLGIMIADKQTHAHIHTNKQTPSAHHNTPLTYWGRNNEF